MTLFLKTATALTTASLLSLGVALAQESETEDTAAAEIEAEVEATVEAEEESTKVMDKTEVTSLAEAQFGAADEDGDEVLNETEYQTFTRGTANQMESDYGVTLDTANEIKASGRQIDVTSSASIAAALKSNDNGRSIYENAEEENDDKVAEAAATRFAEISTDGSVDSSTVITAGGEAFDRANADGNEVLEGEELDRFAEDYTGLKVSAEAEAEVEEETEEEAGS